MHLMMLMCMKSVGFLKSQKGFEDIPSNHDFGTLTWMPLLQITLLVTGASASLITLRRTFVYVFVFFSIYICNLI